VGEKDVQQPPRGLWTRSAIRAARLATGGLALCALAGCSMLGAASPRAAVATSTVRTEGRTFQCIQYQDDQGDTYECAEVNGPYKSTCVVRQAADASSPADQQCRDNYGRSWSPMKEAAPPLPPASQPPPTPG